MMKIICPNKQYTGVSASVKFVNGVGETENQHVIEWFKAHGYEVEEVQQEQPQDDVVSESTEQAETKQDTEPELTVKEIRAQLDAKGIEYNQRAKKEELLALLK